MSLVRTKQTVSSASRFGTLGGASFISAPECGGMYEIGVIGFECMVTEMKELLSGGHAVTSDLASHVISVSGPSTMQVKPTLQL